MTIGTKNIPNILINYLAMVLMADMVQMVVIGVDQSLIHCLGLDTFAVVLPK